MDRNTKLENTKIDQESLIKDINFSTNGDFIHREEGSPKTEGGRQKAEESTINDINTTYNS